MVGSPWQQAWELLYCHTFFLCCLDEIVPAHRNLGAVNWWGHVFCVYMYFEIVGLFVQLFGPPELRSSGNASCFPTAFPYTPSQHKVQRCSSQGMRAPSISFPHPSGPVLGSRMPSSGAVPQTLPRAGIPASSSVAMRPAQLSAPVFAVCPLANSTGMCRNCGTVSWRPTKRNNTDLDGTF